MKELFDFINDSYDPAYSNESANQSTQENLVTNTTTQQQIPTVDIGTAPAEYDKSIRAADTRKSGTTTEAADKSVPLYQINNDLILNLGNETLNQDVQKASSLFKALEQNPVVNGKPIDVSTLSEVIKDPAARQAIMDQAAKLQNDPNLDVEVKWNAHLNDYYASGINAAIPLIKKKMDEQMYNSAAAVDAELKARDKNPNGTNINTTNTRQKQASNWAVVPVIQFFANNRKDDYHDVLATDLFNNKNEFITQNEFDIKFVQRKVESYNQYINQRKKETANASTAVAPSNRGAYVDEKGVSTVYNINAHNQARYADNANLLQQIDPNYKFPSNPKDYTLKDKIQLAIQYKAAGIEDELDPKNRLSALVGNTNSKEAAYLNKTGGIVSFDELHKVTAKNYKQVLQQMQANLHKLGKDDWANDASLKRSGNVYAAMKEKIIEQYNRSDNTAVYKIKAELENKFKTNKGGEIQTEGISMDFNWSSPYKDKNKKKSGGMKQGVNEMGTVMNYVLYDNGETIYSYGGLRKKDIGKYLVPEKDENVSNDIKALTKGIVDDIRAAEQYIIKGKKGSMVLPQGTLTFTRKCFDKNGNEYHAYNIKLNSNYLNKRKYKGTQDNPGISTTHPELAAEDGGFTVFVPAKYTTKTSRVAIETTKADVLSNTEINLALNGKSESYFEGAGKINLTQNNENNTITLDGHYVNFRPSKNAYDTVRIDPQTFNMDQFTDIDRVVEQKIGIIKNYYFNNEKLKRELLEIKGVKDPNQLQQNQ